MPATNLTFYQGKLKKTGKDFSVIIAGGGPEEDKIKTLAKELDVLDKVSFIGWTNNNELPAYYTASDIVVVPSIFDSKGETEGMPVVVNEALSSGVPVIGSRISGIPDVVIPGENGWLLIRGIIQH